jgi:hypothetical protein
MTYRNAVYISSWLEKIGYLDLDGRGNELDGYVIRRQQGSSYPVYELSLFNRRNNFVNLNATEYTPGNTLNQGFGSFNFINTAKGNRYIIYNDNPLNFDIDDKEKVENSSNVSESNTICYSLKNGEWGKKYLYGAPENKRSSNFSFIYSGDYNSKTGLYATMMIKRVNERKETYIAWIPFD